MVGSSIWLLPFVLGHILMPVTRSIGQRGTVTEFTVASTAYGRQRRVWVYLPIDYPQACKGGCPLVVAFDGAEYLDAIPLPWILDSLIAAESIRPTAALLIDDASSSERLADLANHERFARFVGGELLPWLRSRYQVTHDPGQTTITGSSAGGLAAAYLALKRPDLFGKVLSQSGAFWRGNEGTNGAPYEWLTKQYKETPKQPIQFFIDVGSTESQGAMGGTAPSILEANRRFRDVLLNKGYPVDYCEVQGGIHAPSSWRRRLPRGLERLGSSKPVRMLTKRASRSLLP
jgi:enterochelin esterase family protein